MILITVFTVGNASTRIARGLALAALARGEAIYSGDAHGRIRVWDSASVQHGSKAILSAGVIKLAYLDLVIPSKKQQLQLSPVGRICGFFCKNKDCGHEASCGSLGWEFVATGGSLKAWTTLPGRFAGDMLKAASWLGGKFEELLGATAAWSCEQLLSYSHYDVVAAGKGWDTDPWTMIAKDGYFYGRGVSDNKGGGWPWLVPGCHHQCATTRVPPQTTARPSAASPVTGPLLAQIFAVRRLLQGDPSEFCLMGFENEPPQAVPGVQGAPPPTGPGDDQRWDGQTWLHDMEHNCPVNVLFLVDGNEESHGPREGGLISELSAQRSQPRLWHARCRGPGAGDPRRAAGPAQRRQWGASAGALVEHVPGMKG
eukprot:Skav220497  [mRNA]  locus=scaffold1191:82076:90181:- [translate_table: standard]